MLSPYGLELPEEITDTVQTKIAHNRQADIKMIKITELPFNAHLGIQQCAEDQHLLRLPFATNLTNHLGTVHASALFALAEASSGDFLIRHSADDVELNAVVRKVSGKYSAPATGEIHSLSETDPADILAALNTTAEKGRALVTISIRLIDTNDKVVGRFGFDWFLSR